MTNEEFQTLNGDITNARFLEYFIKPNSVHAMRCDNVVSSPENRVRTDLSLDQFRKIIIPFAYRTLDDDGVLFNSEIIGCHDFRLIKNPDKVTKIELKELVKLMDY